MARITHAEMEEVVDFLIDHYCFSPLDRKKIKGLIAQHAEYNTLMIVREGDGIVAVARWNILPTGTDMIILDVAIHPDHRWQDLMHRMVRRGLQLYPKVKYLIYERYDKNKPFVKIPLHRLLKRRF